MNGQLLLLLISMLMQNPGSEVLPELNRNGPSRGLPPGLPAVVPVLPPDMAAANSAVGWGTDKNDGKFCMIIQIAPEAIAAFAKGPQGQELTADVPDGIRNRIEKVIVRVGSGQVERNPPNPQSFSDNRPNGNWPQIAILDHRSTVPIDPLRSPSLLNASGGSGLPTGNGQSNPGNMLNNGQSNIDPGVYPPANPTNYGDRSKQVGTTQSSPLGFLQNRTNSGASGIASSSYPSAQGNYANQPNYANQGNYANQPNYANQGNVPSGTTRSPFMPLAQNTNPAFATPSYNESFAAQPPYSNPNSPPSIAQSQQYGAPPLQQPSLYAPTNPYPTLPNPTYAASPIPVTRPPANSNLTLNENLTNDDQSLSKDMLIPYLLLFSIICNVYLGLWMSKLRDSYRRLVSAQRGIPISDLSN